MCNNNYLPKARELLDRYEKLGIEGKCECNEVDGNIFTCKYCQAIDLLFEINAILGENINLLSRPDIELRKLFEKDYPSEREIMRCVIDLGEEDGFYGNPDCVLDHNRPQDCSLTLTGRVTKKEECEFWVKRTEPNNYLASHIWFWLKQIATYQPERVEISSDSLKAVKRHAHRFSMPDFAVDLIIEDGTGRYLCCVEAGDMTEKYPYNNGFLIKEVDVEKMDTLERD